MHWYLKRRSRKGLWKERVSNDMVSEQINSAATIASQKEEGLFHGKDVIMSFKHPQTGLLNVAWCVPFSLLFVHDHQFLHKSCLDKLTFGSSRHASTPGFKFLRSLNTPSSNFFIFRTGRPNA
jgi:hypothetical protein